MRNLILWEIAEGKINERNEDNVTESEDQSSENDQKNSQMASKRIIY